MTYKAVPCGCEERFKPKPNWKCKDWHVTNVAHVQGVNFTRKQAIAVARLLNEMAKSERGNATFPRLNSIGVSGAVAVGRDQLKTLSGRTK